MCLFCIGLFLRILDVHYQDISCRGETFVIGLFRHKRSVSLMCLFCIGLFFKFWTHIMQIRLEVEKITLKRPPRRRSFFGVSFVYRSHFHILDALCRYKWRWRRGCSALECVAVCCSMLQCAAVCCSVLQCVAVCCSVLHCNTLQHTTYCTATHCNTLQPLISLS